jgi:hypothetical protein
MSKTLVCIDMANLHYYLNKNEWEINWKKFRDYLCGLYGEVLFIFYDGIMNKAHFIAHNPGSNEFDYYHIREQKQKFFKYLKKLGFIVEWKFTASTYSPEINQLRHKCNFDVEITMDALIRINDYDRFVLCSGDRDFLKLIVYLNDQQKETVLIYPKGRTSREFRRSTTGKSFTVGSLKDIVGRPIRPAKNKNQL